MLIGNFTFEWKLYLISTIIFIFMLLQNCGTLLNFYFLSTMKNFIFIISRIDYMWTITDSHSSIILCSLWLFKCCIYASYLILYITCPESPILKLVYSLVLVSTYFLLFSKTYEQFVIRSMDPPVLQIVANFFFFVNDCMWYILVWYHFFWTFFLYISKLFAIQCSSLDTDREVRFFRGEGIVRIQGWGFYQTNSSVTSWPSLATLL